jgi:hypothetical protein
MKGAWAKCPLCGAGIKRSCLRYDKPFPCPECRQLLVAPVYTVAYALAGGVGSCLLAYAFGARGAWLLVATCLLLLPGLFVCGFLWTLFVPPSLRPFNSKPSRQVAHDAIPDQFDTARHGATGDCAVDRRSKRSN